MAMVLVTAVLLTIVSDALATQLSASNRPAATGPLVRDDAYYSGAPCNPGKNARAKTNFCSWLYRFKPRAEDNKKRNYGVLWIQSSALGRHGWCLRRLNERLTLSDKARHVVKVLGKAPAAYTRAGHSVPKKVKLRVTARGHARAPGTLVQHYVLRRGELRRSFGTKSRVFRLKWRGRPTKKKVTLVGGLVVSWPASRGGPPALFHSLVPQAQKPC